MPSVLEALQWPTTPLDAAESRPGPNTRVKTSLLVQKWVEWSDFTYENITAIFGNLLKREYDGQEEPVALKRDVEVYSEASADAGLRRFPFPVINNALNSMKGDDAPYYGHGSRIKGYELKPDWSCISNLAKKDSGYINLVPGDTKTSAKFDPDMLKSNFKEWRKVVRQLAAYADENRVRYGFIVTDKLVVVLRFSREREVAARGVGANLPIRSTRAPAPQVSSEPDIPSSQSSSGPEIPSSQSFEDDNRDQDLRVEYKTIPWSTHGRGRLTAKLALVALAIMSLHGDNYIASSYPGINTWRGGPDGVRHNTSGEFRKMETRGLPMDEPEGEEPKRKEPKGKEPEGEEFEGEDEEDDEDDDEEDDEDDDEEDDEEDDEDDDEEDDEDDDEEDDEDDDEEDDEDDDEEDDEDDDEDDDEEDEPQISAKASIMGDPDHLALDIARLSNMKNVEFTKRKGVWYYKDCQGRPVPYKEGQFEYDTTLKRYVKSGRRYKYMAKSLPDM